KECRRTPPPACTPRPVPENIAEIFAANPFERQSTRPPNSPPRPRAQAPPPTPSEMPDHVPSLMSQAELVPTGSGACANAHSISVATRRHELIPASSLSLLLCELSAYSASLRYLLSLLFFRSLTSANEPLTRIFIPCED